jgi:hypothetical protein
MWPVCTPWLRLSSFFLGSGGAPRPQGWAATGRKQSRGRPRPLWRVLSRGSASSISGGNVGAPMASLPVGSGASRLPRACSPGGYSFRPPWRPHMPRAAAAASLAATGAAPGRFSFLFFFLFRFFFSKHFSLIHCFLDFFHDKIFTHNFFVIV